MTKLREELKEAYKNSYDYTGYELLEELLIENMAEVAKRYILDATRLMKQQTITHLGWSSAVFVYYALKKTE